MMSEKAINSFFNVLLSWYPKYRDGIEIVESYETAAESEIFNIFIRKLSLSHRRFRDLSSTSKHNFPTPLALRELHLTSSSLNNYLFSPNYTMLQDSKVSKEGQ